LYTQGVPCADCARAIIQAGINKVIVHKQWNDSIFNEKWIESQKRSERMFIDCSVELYFYERADNLRNNMLEKW